ncbi:hypothetical protein CPB86DRAFT_772148 [Serendipita vermifera]|nr:hypothetical protein CPB86DRAFT_772148 [Serendipita vermifera]
MADLLAEIRKIPPMTRLAMASAVVITVPSMMKLINPRAYYFDWPLITNKVQIYRLYTSLWIPWSLDNPIKWLFDLVMLYRHLEPMEQKSYHKRLPDMVWQFFWCMGVIQALCYPLHFPLFWTPLLGFVVYLSSRLNPHETISFFGLFSMSIKYYPFVLVAFDMMMSPMIGCGTIAGLIVGQALFMLEYDAPSESNGLTEPRLKQSSMLRAPGWLCRLLVEPEVQNRAGTIRSVYGQVVTPAGRGLNDNGRGANTASGSGYNWGKGQKLGT